MNRGTGILRNRREQQPVGQGFFHTGALLAASAQFRYVYDCGSEDGKDLIRSIEGYLAQHGHPPRLDVLFLSHLHRDHVSGLDRLLGSAPVETVVLPYLSPAERLALVADTFQEGASAEASYVQLLSDPPRWFGERGVRRIIQVEGGEGPGPEMPEILEPVLPSNPELLALDMRHVRSAGSSSKISPGHGRSADVFVVPHTVPLRVAADAVGLNWVFITHVHPEDSRLAKFQDAVEKAFGRIQPEKWLVDVVQNPARRAQLARCYDVIRRDHNLTCLSLYSGPLTMAEFEARIRVSGGPPWHVWWDYPRFFSFSDRCAWLGSGDSNLSVNTRRRQFLQHFARVIRYVHTFALPHHGSRHSFSPELLDMGAVIWVAAAGTPNSYGHPHGEVIHSVTTAGRAFVQVGGDPGYTLREEIALNVE